jgi:MFS family permease
MNASRRTVAASLLAVFTVVVDNTKVNVALPTLAHALAVDETTLQWVVESYVLAFAAPLLLGGAIADRIGPGVTMRAGLLGFAAGSVVAAMAPSAGVLVAARVLTGLAAALVMPATLAAVVAAVPQERSRAVAGWTGVVALGVAVGPVVGGALLVVAPWPSLFWLNVPLALGAAVALSRTARPAPAVARLDVRGSVLLAGVMLGVVAAVTEAPRHAWLVVPAGACALLCAVGYARHQRRGDPVLPLGLFRAPALRASIGALSAMFAAIFGIAFLLPQYLQLVRGVGPLGTGLYVLAYAFALVLASLAAGAVPMRRRRLLVTCGLLATAAVHAVTALGLAPATSAWALAAGLAAVGVGIGLAQAPLTELLLSAVGPRTGLGSALNDAVREVGGVVGVAVLGSVMVAVTGSAATGPALLDGVRVAAAVAAALLAIAAAVTARSATFATDAPELGSAMSRTRQDAATR